MNGKQDKEMMVKDSLFQFIKENIPNANLSVIDEIVLSYVISILDEASTDPYYELEGFIEVMSDYVPEFETIDPAVVCAWFVDLEAKLKELRNNAYVKSKENGEKDIKLELQNICEIVARPPPKQTRSHSNSESSTEGERRVVETDEYAEQCRILHEMFPNTCAMEIKHCVSIAGGDAERAAATLLHRREQGQALSAAALHSAARPLPCDDYELKNRIIARYSYVDKNSDTKEHKPLAPKFEPKKMVRYRDNKIVSLKGERYTEVPKSGVDEEHLKKPKKQHCP
ncbi:CUE domain-containing protein 2 [Aricia agestis]|uniref:CUE domain-containing protein 2 n=1 Tax=Aricia agestis TaxID=91739 RepID=UPI001C2089A4|nr:CUE domain-containing protein 2 [Aricia agestis]